MAKTENKKQNSKNKRDGQNSQQRQKQKKPKVKVFIKKKKESEEIFIKQLQDKYDTIDTSTIKSFNDLPLSKNTLRGLKESGYTKPTEIQKDSIGLALQGKDILGAAKTGSGKTLAFIIPILEHLYCKQWTHLDGLGALIITPTRELAYQIFETIRNVGRFHDFSAGLIIGGKDLKFERNRMDKCNIIICTPGRLLQHMDENPLLDCVMTKILVLDEADRILDMGFKKTMNDIIANLPPKRQTLLFSATQTKSVKDLARLSLKDPSYVAVHEHEKYSTPSTLEQSYVVCKLEDKVSIIWSFIKNHLKQKSIIFLNTCKEVKYFFEMFSKLRPGLSLMALYGTLHQQRRMAIYDDFSKKKSAVLFATDLVSRGLDFPEVHWVVQADCPEDADTYIHRVGRTARYHRNGQSLMLVLPSEVAIVDQLEEKKIPINKIDINPTHMQNPIAKMRAFLINEELKETAKRAFMHYVKSYFLMKNKEVFKVEELDRDAFALSLGLTVVPRVRFLERKLKSTDGSKVESKNHIRFGQDEVKIKSKSKPDISDENAGTSNSTNDEFLGDADDVNGDLSDGDGKNIRSNGIYNAISGIASCYSSTRKSVAEKIEFQEVEAPKTITKVALAKKMMKKSRGQNKKIVFEDDEEENVSHFDQIKGLLENAVKDDKQQFHQNLKERRQKEKKKLKDKKKKEYEQQGKDDFGTDSEDEPDLSWLPDPDKVYNGDDQDNVDDEGNEDDYYDKSENNKSQDDDKSEDDDDESGDDKSEDSKSEDDKSEEDNDKAPHVESEEESNDEDLRKSKAKKINKNHTGNKKRKFEEVQVELEEKQVKEKVKKKKTMEKIAKSLSVNEAEELALMLLRK